MNYKIQGALKGGLLLAGASGCSIPVDSGYWKGKRITIKECASWLNPIEELNDEDTGYVGYGNECLKYVSGASYALPYTYNYLTLYRYGYQLFLEFSPPYAILTYMYAYRGYNGFFGYAFSLIGRYEDSGADYNIEYQDSTLLHCKPVRERLVCDTEFGVVEFVQRFGEFDLNTALNSFN